jgi:anion-transporting  ArsA/GET3 family ATPase
VDTPPSRNALDFLDAPERMGRFLDGRFIRLLFAPAKAGGKLGLKVVSVGFGMFTSVLTKVLGGQLLKDVSTFVTAFDTVFGGFRERAEKTYQLLQTPGTAFLVVAAPEPDALREASYFVERLATERMPLAGLIVNRMAVSGASSLSAARSQAAAETLEERGGEHALTASLLRLHAERMQLAARQGRLRDHFSSAHPTVPVAAVPAQAEDVHDLDGLRRVGEDLSVQTPVAAKVVSTRPRA